MTERPTFAELISRAGHELRSPLTSVKGFSSTLVKRWDRFTDDERFQFVDAIKSDAERMERIISEVLDLARLDSGTLQLQQGPVPIDKLVARVLEHLGSRPGAERVVVDIREGTTAWTDGERLERDLTNVIENALKFSQEGPISVAAAVMDGGVVELSVRDRGVGIEEERVVDVMSGPGPSRQMATPQGTGLGLYLARQVLELQGGSLSVSSEAKVGSTFTMRVPAHGAT